MLHSKYETAGYILKKINKEQNYFMNSDLFNAYSILYHLKMGEIDIA